MQAWIWAYFPHFRHNAIMNTAAFENHPTAWREGAPVEVPEGKSVARLRSIRRILDDVSHTEVSKLSGYRIE